MEFEAHLPRLYIKRTRCKKVGCECEPVAVRAEP